MIRSAASLLLVLATACGGGAKSTTGASTAPKETPDPIPHTAGPACSVVAEKLAIVVEADQPDAQASTRATLLSRCNDDKWSDEARSCFATVENDDEVEGCRKQLTDAQRGAWTNKHPAAEPAAATVAPGTSPKKQGTTRSADPEEGGE